MGEAQLEGLKQTGSTGPHGPHEAEFTKHFLSFLNANFAFAMKVLKNGKDPVLLPIGEFQGTLSHVQDPTQDFLPLAPSAISFQELLRYGFLALHCHLIQLQEDAITVISSGCEKLLSTACMIQWQTL